MKDQINWGFVGAGAMARAQAGDLKFVPDAKIYGVTARTQASADAFAKDFDAIAFPTLEAMLDDEAINLVYVNSPNQMHYPQVKLALEAGKPVLCEKPFTLNAPQLEELIQLARSKGLFLMEAMWVRYLPAAVRLRQLLAEGAIGELQWFQAGFHIQPPLDMHNRWYNPDLGGGALLDVGIYPISFASMLLGAPQSILSRATLAPSGVDASFGALFHYASGAQASVSASLRGYFEDDIVLLGSQGQIHIRRRNGYAIDRLRVVRGETVEEFDLPIEGKGYGYQAAEVCRCLAAGEFESPQMPLDESLSLMRTLDSLRAEWGVTYPGE